MDKSDRPDFTPEVEAHIEKIQNRADLLAWQQLRALQVPTAFSRKMMRSSYPPEFVGPPDSKKPNEIRLHIRAYARTLYFVEGNLYRDEPRVEAQLRKLAERIVQRVTATIADVEESTVKLSTSLAHHGLSLEQMKQAALDEVNDLIGKRLNPLTPRVVPAPPIELRHERSVPMKDHPLPQTSHPVLTGKQAASYARAGIDMASAGPLLAMLEAQANQTEEQPPQPNPREAFVLPILETKGWSILDWSNEAEVAYHTAADYLEGKTKPYRSSRLKMSKALGVTVQQLPR